MSTKANFSIRKALDWLENKHMFLELFEATGFFLKQSDTRVEIQYYVDPLAVAKTTLMAAITHINKMEGAHISHKKLLIFSRKRVIFEADNIELTPVSEKELDWLLNSLAVAQRKDATQVVSLVFTLEARVSEIKS